jgi:hypothetical protein
MSLRSVLEEIQADVDARVTRQMLGDAPEIEWLYGKKSLELNGAPPRIVWVRTPGSYAPVDYKPQSPARPLRTRIQPVDAHVWAPSDDEGSDAVTEELSSLLVAAAYRVAVGSFEVVGDSWPDDQDTDLGHVCIVSFRFFTPVLDDKATTVVLSSANAFPFDARDAVSTDKTLQLGEGDPPDPALP